MPSAAPHNSPGLVGTLGTPGLLGIISLTLLLGGTLVGWQALAALDVLVRESAVPLLMLAAALGFGLWPTHKLLGNGPSRSWLIFGAIASGLGILATFALVLGVLGCLARGLWWSVLLAGIAGGVLFVWKHRTRLLAPLGSEPLGIHAWIILIVAPFLALSVLAATTPPGVLWAEEGFGYDVLEYHLALPKEYFQAGRIEYLPHNVFANFPSNVEMLYLWTMVLCGGAIKAAIPAKLLNLSLGILAACSCGLAGREVAARTALWSAVLMAGTGWLVYLSGVAYVENGMLLFAVLAVAATLKAMKVGPPGRVRLALLAGLMAGFSCGCKYSAMGLVFAPLCLLWILLPIRSRRDAWQGSVAFLLGTLAAFSPWLAKNSIMTGDPVFPLGPRVFAPYPAGWDAERDDHFRACTSPQRDEAALSGRFGRLWERVLCDPHQRIASWLWVLGLFVTIARWRDPTVRALWLLLGAQIAIWLFASHLYARFAVPMLIPLVLLVARGTSACRSRRSMGVFRGLLLAGLAANLFFAARLYARHLYVDGEHLPVHGLTELFTEGQWPGQEHLGVLNALPEGSKVLMIGDARTFYVRTPCDYSVVFNRNPLARQIARSQTPEEIVAWLVNKGYTHVYMDHGETERLATSQYGFPDALRGPRFDRMVPGSLEPVESFSYPGAERQRSALFSVPIQNGEAPTPR